MKKLLCVPMILLCGSFLQAQNWYQIPTGTTKKLNTIDFPSNQVGYIGGNDSLLLKTTDGGQTWNEVNYSGISFFPGGEHFVKLQFITEAIGFATVGPYSGSYKTIDGGTTWTALPLSSNLCYNEGMFFFDENNGVIAGAGCFQGELVDRLTAGTWSAASVNFNNLNSGNLVTDVDFRGNLGLASSYGGRFLRSTDGGQNWNSIASPYGTETPLLSIAIIDDTLCFAGYDAADGQGYGLLRSHDAGLTWSEESQMSTFAYPDYFGIHLAGSGKVYAGAGPYLSTYGMIFTRSNDLNWVIDQVDYPIYDLSSYQDSIVFGVGDSGYVVVNVPLAILSTNDFISEEVSDLFVYPNPTNGNISFSRSFSENTSYRLVTMDGKVISTDKLVNSELDLSPFPKGQYLVELIDGANYYTQRIIKE